MRRSPRLERVERDIDLAWTARSEMRLTSGVGVVAAQRVQFVDQLIVAPDGHDDGCGFTRGVGQDDVACAGGHLIDQVLVKFTGRDQLTGDGLCAAEGLNGGVDQQNCLSFVEVLKTLLRGEGGAPPSP